MNRFFLYDPNNGFDTFKTAEERDATAQEAIELHSDDGWSEEVGCICVGEITGQAMQTNVRPRPERGDYATEEEHDDAMSDWGGDPIFDEICNYEIRPLPSPESATGGINSSDN